MTMQGFWRQLNYDNRRLVLRDSAQVNNVWYVYPQGGGPAGPHTVQSMSAISGQLRDRDVIVLGGVLLEQFLAPPVNDVLLIGAANRPRQATDNGVPNGGGACWLAPAVPVANRALLDITAQSWTVKGIQFAPPAALDSIRLRAESASLGWHSGSHSIIDDCYFLGGGAGGHGINLGETGRGVVQNCRFELLTGTAIRRSADLGVSATQHWDIINNQFKSNGNDIILTAQNMLIKGNEFFDAVDGARKFVQLLVGAGNKVFENWFYGVATAGYTIANGFEGVASTVWRNYVNDAVDPIIVDPA